MKGRTVRFNDDFWSSRRMQVTIQSKAMREPVVARPVRVKAIACERRPCQCRPPQPTMIRLTTRSRPVNSSRTQFERAAFKMTKNEKQMIMWKKQKIAFEVSTRKRFETFWDDQNRIESGHSNKSSANECRRQRTIASMGRPCRECNQDQWTSKDEWNMFKKIASNDCPFEKDQKSFFLMLGSSAEQPPRQRMQVKAIESRAKRDFERIETS